MKEALKLLFLRARLIKMHWETRNLVSICLVSAGVLVLFYFKSNIFPLNKQNLGLIWMILANALFAVMFACITAFKTWFTSEDAFYYTTAPLGFYQMYTIHCLNTWTRFIYVCGPMMMTGLIFLAIKLHGVVIGLAIVAFFLGLLILSVNLGFFIMFYLMYFKNRLVNLLGLPVALAILSSGFLYFWFNDHVLFYAGITLLCLFIIWLAPNFARRVYYLCLDSAGVEINFEIKSQVMKRTVLYNSFLPRVFRAILYKELVTDKRSFYLYVRYGGSALFMLLYLPLSKIAFFSDRELMAAILFFYFMVFANFHETYSTTFIKEGNILSFILPASRSWWLGIAKFSTGMLQIIPLIILATLLTWYKLSLGLGEAITFAILLLLLNSAHISILICLGSRLLNMETRDMGIMESMIYEYSFANFNPQVIYMFFWTLLLPVGFIGLIWSIGNMPGGMSLVRMWLLITIAATVIIICLNLGRRLYNDRFQQLLN